MGAMAVGGRSRINRERDVVDTSFSIRSIDVENFILFIYFSSYDGATGLR